MTKGLFCVGFLQNKNYLSPQNYNPFDHDHNLVLLEEFQLDLTKFEQVINYATK